MATAWETMYSMDTRDKGIIHASGGTEQRDAKFHHTAQYGMRLNFYELFISRIFSFNLFRL